VSSSTTGFSLRGFRITSTTPRANVATDRPTPLTDAERAEYDAIGESDRMTLRFRKPG
jgi:predicted methyltransferase